MRTKRPSLSVAWATFLAAAAAFSGGCGRSREAARDQFVATSVAHVMSGAPDKWWLTSASSLDDDTIIRMALERRAALIGALRRCEGIDAETDGVITYAGRLAFMLQRSPTEAFAIRPEGITPLMVLVPQEMFIPHSPPFRYSFADKPHTTIRYAAAELPEALAASCLLHEAAHAYAYEVEHSRLNRDYEETRAHRMSGSALRHLLPAYDSELRHFTQALPASATAEEAMLALTPAELRRLDACLGDVSTQIARGVATTSHVLQVGWLQQERHAGADTDMVEVYRTFVRLACRAFEQRQVSVP